MEEKSDGKIIDEFVWLKSKMYLMVSDDGKESNTTKGVNIATEFNELETIYLTKKYLDTKWEEFKAKT